MIFFCDSNGTIQKSFGTPVYQGAANSNVLYLIAPYAPNSSVMAAFQLPDGTAVAPVAMTPQNAVPGVQNADGTTFAGWSYVLPGSVTAKYGTVTAQFFFYAPAGESTSPTSIIATSAATFQVGRGAAIVLPDTPDADVYASILANIAQLQTDLTGGYYAARAIYAWNDTYTYGANEITFYPVGNYGSFVKSVVNSNTGNVPYINGNINSAYWSEVTNFNTIASDFYAEIQSAVQSAQAAQTGAKAAQSAAETAQSQAAGSASAAAGSATASAGSASDSAESAVQAANSASAASGSAAQAGTYATQAQQSAAQASNSASQAGTYAQNSASSATAAQGYAQQAQQYAQKHYQIVNSISDLPRPGDSAFIYLVPTNSGTAGDSYSEYLWISESNDYEFIGTTADIDLSNYAQINGTYSGMTVGKATQADNAATATDAEKLGGVLANQYAIVTGTYADMTVGNATNATNADTADSATSAQDSAKLGGVAAANYAQIDGTYTGMTVGAATKATQDNDGNVISATYATKQNASGGFEGGNGASAVSGGGAVGYNASAVSGGGAVGYNASATAGGGAVGQGANTTYGGAVGQGASSSTGFAGGYLAKATADGAVQLGEGTNATANTLQFRNTQIIDNNGNILDESGNVISNTYAKQTGTYPNLTAGGAELANTAPNTQAKVPNGDDSEKIATTGFVASALIYNGTSNYGYRGKSYSISKTSTPINFSVLSVNRAGNVITISGWGMTNASVSTSAYALLNNLPSSISETYGTMTFAGGTSANMARVFIQPGATTLYMATNFTQGGNAVASGVYVSFEITYMTDN